MAELRFIYDNLIRLEARPPNMEGSGEVTIRHLVKNALRIRFLTELLLGGFVTRSNRYAASDEYRSRRITYNNPCQHP